MRKVNAKKKPRKEKEIRDNSSDERDEEENKDSKNGGSEDESIDMEQKKKKGKKGSSEHSSSDNGNVSEDEEDAEEYEVDEVVDHKVESGTSYFLIKWKGYDSEGNTWEPEDTLSCPDLIAKFKKKIKRPKSKNDTGVVKKKSKQNDEKKQTSSDPNQEWEVEKIIDVAQDKEGSRLFRIRWKGYRPNQDTWEPEENLNCEGLIDKFLKKREEDSKRPQKELREAPKQTQPYVTNSFGRRASKRNTARARAVYYDAE